jgi:predicted nucleic acid-binding Zn ribbon protein
MTIPDSTEVRHCIKCGREIGPDETLCRACNRAGMATPSASQYHATVAAAIVLAVVGLAVAASLSLRGVGPYGAEIRVVQPGTNAGGYAVTYEVTNEGTKPGRAKCQLVALGPTGERLRARNTVTPQIEGSATVALTETIPGLEAEPDEVRISCS